MSDRALSIENARYIFNNLKTSVMILNLKRWNNEYKELKVLTKAADLLKTIETMGIFKTIEKRCIRWS